MEGSQFNFDAPDVLYIDLTGSYTRLEKWGAQLASFAGAWIREELGDELGPAIAAGMAMGAPVGPDFDYAGSMDLFGTRRGRGPLYIAWDTNLLIDYFDFGARLWRGEGLPESLEEGNYLALEGLELLLALWVVRDIRFVLLPQVISDARKRLSDQRRRDRINAFQEFVGALRLVSSTTDGDNLEAPSRAGLLELPNRIIDDTLQAVPAGLDRQLVRAAVRSGVHVMITKDRGMLRGAQALRRLGLAITDPQELLEWLFASGSYHCLLDPRFLYWPMPDQQRIAHLIAAIPDHGL
ncbi:hypothetical protein [Jiangella muralis]|uniref:hypothetical protein n=1 Tax=Jiangella muralis TaxID=702383 RepID=UPI0012F78B2B|nr:hypothetical protein [Jiangella muralis]